ncbi:MAG: SurA N-terminal domain-containing protein [Gammaproteobacteria bacterium]|nr:SurA N-terminal domain-containing protein [Gammaproteobacteria bacterium]
MLYLIRERAKSWVLWGIILLLIATFALWGINSYLGGPSQTKVLQINGDDLTQSEIDQAVKQRRREYRQALGDAFQPAMFEDDILRPMVEQQLVSEILLNQQVRAAGFTITEAALADILGQYEAFQTDGVFDLDRYAQAIRSQGLTPAEFEARMAASLAQQQLISGIRDSALPVTAEATRALQLWQQQRSGYYGFIDGNPEAENWTPSEAEIQSHYESNPGPFSSRETVTIEYLELDSADLHSVEGIDEAALRQRYESEIENLRSPVEVRAAHILLTLREDADPETTRTVLARAESLIEQLQQGADFAKLAAAHSEDRSTASQGGDLGWLTSGMVDPDLETAALALQPGQISAAVRTRFGYHILQVRERRGGEAPSYDALRDELLTQAEADAAEALYVSRAERLQALAYEQPDNLDAAASALELTIQTLGPITRAGGPGIAANPEILSQAFSDPVLKEGLNSEAVELSPGRMVVLRLARHNPAAVRPLDEVRDEVVLELRQRHAATTARTRGSELLAKIKADPVNAGAVAEAEGVQLQPFEQLTRTDFAEPGRELIQYIFSASRPEPGMTTASGSLLEDGRFGLILLQEVAVAEGDESDAETLEQIMASLTQQRGEAAFSDYLEALRRQAKIKRY